jgi:hypothetical protein
MVRSGSNCSGHSSQPDRVSSSASFRVTLWRRSSAKRSPTKAADGIQTCCCKNVTYGSFGVQEAGMPGPPTASRLRDMRVVGRFRRGFDHAGSPQYEGRRHAGTVRSFCGDHEEAFARRALSTDGGWVPIAAAARGRLPQHRNRPTDRPYATAPVWVTERE